MDDDEEIEDNSVVTSEGTQINHVQDSVPDTDDSVSRFVGHNGKA
jgi:hypothetical protein